MCDLKSYRDNIVISENALTHSQTVCFFSSLIFAILSNAHLVFEKEKRYS